MNGRVRIALVLAGLVACGGPDPLIGLLQIDGGEIVELDATTHHPVADASCFFCGDASDDVGVVVTTPPPVLCPATEPTAGEACGVPTYEDCEYGSSTYDCNDHFFCSLGGFWELVDMPCEPQQSCSTVVDGGPCDSISETCADPDAGSECVCAACGIGSLLTDAGVWHCFAQSSACGAIRENGGTACDLDGAACRYSAGECCGGFYDRCTDGVWVTTPGFCSPPPPPP